MKASTSKPVPSPGRANKYPPPLMRFLRSNVGSRSGRKGRSSRATSLFMRRKRTTAIEAQQEPSSPKVTCIGQVRVRRSSSGSSKSKPGPKKGTQKRKPTSDAVAGNRFCYWVWKPPAPCCRRRRRLPGFFRPGWRKWVSFFHCRNIWVRTNSSKKWPNPTIDSDRRDGDEEREAGEEENRESFCLVNGSDIKSGGPPKNALLLTRCRSAPQRSSYLANRFWGSPLKTGEQENRETGAAGEEELGALEIEKIPKDTAAASRFDLKVCKEDAVEEEEEEEIGSLNKIEKNRVTPTTVEEEGPVMLTRSKSEPARRLGDPLTSSFWKNSRLEMESSLSSSAHSVENNN